MEYAAHLLNRCEVGQDGRTAHERFKGNAHLVGGGVEFGESDHWQESPASCAEAKFASTWRDGVFSWGGGRGRARGAAHRGHGGRRLEDKGHVAQAV